MRGVIALRTLAGASLLTFLSAPEIAAHASEPPTVAYNAHLQKGASFVKTRANLIKSGWQPVRTHADGYEYDGTEKRLVERRFLEVDSCSTDRGGLCIFYYAKNGTCLRVDTIGEQVDAMRVTRWDDSCPEAPPEHSESPGRRP
jgi:hypothetical protein